MKLPRDSHGLRFGPSTTSNIRDPGDLTCQSRATGSRPPNPRFPFPRFPIWPGNGEGFPVSRFGRERETGPRRRFGRKSESGNRGYSSHVSTTHDPQNADFWPPPILETRGNFEVGMDHPSRLMMADDARDAEMAHDETDDEDDVDTINHAKARPQQGSTVEFGRLPALLAEPESPRVQV